MNTPKKRKKNSSQMDPSAKTNFLLPITLMFFFFFFFFLCFKPTLAADDNPTINYTSLVYNHCPKQTLTSIPSSSLSSLFEQLISHSSQSKFFETMVTHENTAIWGLFQCRGDLSSKACNNCVNRVGKLSNTLCANSVPARIQLSGCYFRYEADNEPVVNSRFELLHKKCGEWKEEFDGFKEKREVGFEEITSCVASSKEGFCKKEIEEMEFMAQCGEKLRGCECGDCVYNALQIAEEECKDSDSAQIYVEGCFVSYSYEDKSHGDHKKPYGEKESGGGGGGSSTKLVAMVVGGAVALALVAILLYSIKTCGKKDDDW